MEYLILIPLAALSYFLVNKAFIIMRDRVFIPMEEAIQEQVPSVPEKGRFFGGPLDGYVDLMPEHLPFYVAPYRGAEPQIKEYMGMQVEIPSLAWYRHIEDESYFYVRDISQDEYKVMSSTGIEPLPELPEQATE